MDLELLSLLFKCDLGVLALFLDLHGDIALLLVALLHVKKRLEEVVNVVQSECLFVDIVQLNFYGMIVARLLELVVVDDRTIVDDDLQPEAGRVVILREQVLENAEVNARHEVHAHANIILVACLALVTDVLFLAKVVDAQMLALHIQAKKDDV